MTERLAGKRVACWVSGGNATADSLRRALEHDAVGFRQRV
jgi:hypothetical protein